MGIRSTISRLAQLLKEYDEELWRHLEITTKVSLFVNLHTQRLLVEYFYSRPPDWILVVYSISYLTERGKSAVRRGNTLLVCILVLYGPDIIFVSLKSILNAYLMAFYIYSIISPLTKRMYILSLFFSYIVHPK